jgi:hypothetical protein
MAVNRPRSSSNFKGGSSQGKDNGVTSTCFTQINSWIMLYKFRLRGNTLIHKSLIKSFTFQQTSMYSK